jgi:hypothetical protein
MTNDPAGPSLVDRREAIRRVGALLGGVAFVGGSSLVAACERAGRPGAATTAAFTASDIAFLDEIAETILPETKTPGAKAARTGAFMAMMVTDCYRPAEQRAFRDGMRSVDEACRKANTVPFMEATPAQRLAVLTILDREQKAFMDARESAARQKKGLPPAPGLPPLDANSPSADAMPHYFRMMKELTLLGFFTSEIGYTKVLRYAESPGRYDPCATYTPGEAAWAPHA